MALHQVSPSLDLPPSTCSWVSSLQHVNMLILFQDSPSMATSMSYSSQTPGVSLPLYPLSLQDPSIHHVLLLLLPKYLKIYLPICIPTATAQFQSVSLTFNTIR